MARVLVSIQASYFRGCMPTAFEKLRRGTIIHVDTVVEVVRENAEKQFALLKGRQEDMPA